MSRAELQRILAEIHASDPQDPPPDGRSALAWWAILTGLPAFWAVVAWLAFGAPGVWTAFWEVFPCVAR
jgi:hypothetical protein